MTEIKGDLWTWPRGVQVDSAGNVYSEDDNLPIIRCITTNGMVKSDGTCVMGRGCAKEAATKWPTLPRLLGSHIRKEGNVVGYFCVGPGPELRIAPQLLSFPVKHHWKDEADPDLIAASARDLKEIAEKLARFIFLLPRPGCGNGKLKWDDVKPLLALLPDNVLVITDGR